MLPCLLEWGKIDRHMYRGRFKAAGDRRPRALGIRICAMGDKSKKDKDKGQKQNIVKQKQKAEVKSQKQPKKAS
jgi:hypothetical protein